VISALLLAGFLSAAPDNYAAVEEANLHAVSCEARVVGDAFLDRVERSMEKIHADAKRQCTEAWADHAKARQTYYLANRQLLRRLVPGFRPTIEACWTALNGQRNDWPGAPKNTALEECKNAQD
jgi:hypothetical protein